MATKYVRAGGGDWNVDATWSLSSGGPADTVVPTANDRVDLDALSGNVLVDGVASCWSLLVAADYSGVLTLTSGCVLLTRMELTVYASSDAIVADPESRLMIGDSDEETTVIVGGTAFGNIQILPGSGLLTFHDSFTFADMTMTSAGTRSIVFTSGTTLTMTGDTFLSGTAGNLITLVSGGPGSPFTLSNAGAEVGCDYLSLQDSHAEGGANWYAGANSVNVSGNDGWIWSTMPTWTRRALCIRDLRDTVRLDDERATLTVR